MHCCIDGGRGDEGVEGRNLVFRYGPSPRGCGMRDPAHRRLRCHRVRMPVGYPYARIILTFIPLLLSVLVLCDIAESGVLQRPYIAVSGGCSAWYIN